MFIYFPSKNVYTLHTSGKVGSLDLSVCDGEAATVPNPVPLFVQSKQRRKACHGVDTAKS